MNEVLVVRLIEARDLKRAQTSGLADPVVKITFGSTILKSKTVRDLLFLCFCGIVLTPEPFPIQVKKTLNPTYDEMFVFKIPTDMPRSVWFLVIEVVFCFVLFLCFFFLIFSSFGFTFFPFRRRRCCFYFVRVLMLMLTVRPPPGLLH